MNYDIHLENIPANQPLAVVRRRANQRDLPKVVPEACGLVWNEIRKQQIPGAGRHIAVYLDEQINLEVGVELSAPLPPTAVNLISSSIPAGAVATTTHLGPYQQLAAAHHAIRDWCAKRGHALAGPNWEIYGHWEDAWNNDPAKIRTDVYYLVTPRGK